MQLHSFSLFMETGSLKEVTLQCRIVDKLFIGRTSLTFTNCKDRHSQHIVMCVRMSYTHKPSCCVHPFSSLITSIAPRHAITLNHRMKRNDFAVSKRPERLRQWIGKPKTNYRTSILRVMGVEVGVGVGVGASRAL